MTRELPTRDLLLAVDLSGSMDAEDFTSSDGRKIDRLTAHLRVEIKSSVTDAAVVQYYQHGMHRVIQVCCKLVGIPAVLWVTSIGVDTAQ